MRRFEEMIDSPAATGFMRIRLNGEFFDLEQDGELRLPFDRKRKNELFLVIDRLKVDPTIKPRLFEAVENAATIGEGKTGCHA